MPITPKQFKKLRERLSFLNALQYGLPYRKDFSQIPALKKAAFILTDTNGKLFVSVRGRCQMNSLRRLIADTYMMAENVDGKGNPVTFGFMAEVMYHTKLADGKTSARGATCPINIQLWGVDIKTKCPMVEALKAIQGLLVKRSFHEATWDYNPLTAQDGEDVRFINVTRREPCLTDHGVLLPN